MNEKLQIVNLKKSYNKNFVFDNLNFMVYDGEFLSILGPSGCGKTTLMNVITGLIKEDSGKLFKNTVDITQLEPSKRGMGIVFQDYALFPNMSVLKNVEYALKFKKDNNKNITEIAMDMLKKVELEDHLNKMPSQLSGGQKQRVAIARTLALHPEIILFDEPMSALDVDTRLQLRKVIKQIQNEFNTTIIYITHDQEEAFALSDRIMVMNYGKIVQLDTPHNILHNPADSFVEDFVVKNLDIKLKSLQKYMR